MLASTCTRESDSCQMNDASLARAEGGQKREFY